VETYVFSKYCPGRGRGGTPKKSKKETEEGVKRKGQSLIIMIGHL